MALEPRRYDRILNEAPDDVLGAIFGFSSCALCADLPSNIALTRLDVSRCRIDDAALVAIFRAGFNALRIMHADEIPPLTDAMLEPLRDAACCPALVALHLRGIKHHGRVTVQGVDDMLVARGLKPMAQRGTGLPGLRGEGLEILGAFLSRPGWRRPPPWAEPPPPSSPEISLPETLVDDVPETVGF